MKVAMVVSHFQPEFGGHEFYLCKSLVKMGIDVTLYTSDRGRPGYSNEKFLNDNVSYEFEVKRFHAPLEISEIPFCKGLKKELNEDKFDIIHSHEFFQVCSLTAYKVSKNKNLPFILTQHGSSPPINGFIRVGYLIDKNTVGKYIMKKADGIIALTPKVRNDLVNLGIPKTNIQVISTGVPIKRYSPNIESSLKKYVPDQEKVILFVGRLTENKGVINLLKAFQKVRAHIHNVKLVVVGKGKMEIELKNLARKLGIEKDTIFIRYVPQKDMPMIYAGADVFVLPTLYKEPFGIAAIEALSSGVPIVASNIGGLSLIVKNGEVGYLTKPGDIQEISSRIIQILEDEKLRKNLAIRARERAIIEFSWENKAEAVHRTYKKALSQHL